MVALAVIGRFSPTTEWLLEVPVEEVPVDGVVVMFFTYGEGEKGGGK